jgi:hypothetical protein
MFYLTSCSAAATVARLADLHAGAEESLRWRLARLVLEDVFDSQ